MSPQNKLIANSTGKKVFKKASGKTIKKVSPRPLQKMSPKPLQKVPKKPFPSGNSSRLTEDMIETIGAGIYLVQKGKFVSVSSTFEKLAGYSATDLIGKKFLDHVHPDDRKKIQSSQKKKNSDPYEYRFIKNNIDVIWFLETSDSVVHQGAKAMLGSVMDITRYKQTGDVIGLKEERYRTILEEINEGYAELDLAGNWTFVNEAVARNMGYTQQEMIGTNYRQYTDEASAKRMFEIYNNLYKTGQPFKGIEVELITKQGNRRVEELSGALIRDKKGRPIGFRGLARDITERKWAEDALLQSEAKYFSIIESIGQAYFETDITGVFTFINDKVCKDLGYTRKELLHMSNRDLQDEASAQETYAIFNEVYETGLPVREFQFKANRKDGSKAVFELSISLMRDAQGKPIGFRGLSRDITERKKMENALKASEERARTLIATIPDPYVERDLQGRAIYVNAAYAALTGYSVDELCNIDYNQYVDAKNAEIVSSTYDTIVKTGLTMKNVEVGLNTKSGEKRLVNLSASLIRDPQGNPTGVQAILRDITEKKKAEELIRRSEQSLREYSETLELRVRERTAELEKAKVAAEAASRAKSDFMANISHEFQTPLNAVIGFTKVLQDRMFGELNEKQEEFIRYIAEAGISLSRIITEILDASHAAQGRAKLNLSPVPIVSALMKTTRLLTPQIDEKKQVLAIDTALDADVSIEADEQKIQQVFFHLLSNAVKYTTDGGKINVRAARTSHPVSKQGGVSIAIADTGTGIKAEDIPKLFQTFGTLESPYTRSGKGIGIGLALTKQLVELHGGDISVQSVYGSGSCFTVFLPLKQKQTGLME